MTEKTCQVWTDPTNCLILCGEPASWVVTEADGTSPTLACDHHKTTFHDPLAAKNGWVITPLEEALPEPDIVVGG